MSERGPGVTDLPLFAPVEPAPAPVRTVHDRFETEHADFLNRVRRILAGMYAGRPEPITTDEAWDAMERYGIKLPPGASPNILGSLFSAWPRARSTGQMKRSKRRGANGNALMQWVID